MSYNMYTPIKLIFNPLVKLDGIPLGVKERFIVIYCIDANIYNYPGTIRLTIPENGILGFELLSSLGKPRIRYKVDYYEKPSAFKKGNNLLPLYTQYWLVPPPPVRVTTNTKKDYIELPYEYYNIFSIQPEGPYIIEGKRIQFMYPADLYTITYQPAVTIDQLIEPVTDYKTYRHFPNI